jgi:hypothetical protein
MHLYNYFFERLSIPWSAIVDLCFRSIHLFNAENNISNAKAEIHKFGFGSSLATKFLEKDMGTIAA